MSIGGLRWWNFWSRIDGALYGFRGIHPRSGHTVFVYGGKTFQRDWKDRIRQHLWGGGRYDSVPKPWADTVLGWRPDGTVEECIRAGGVFLIRKPSRVSPFGLWWREIIFAIWLRLPLYNVQWNLHNPRRIRPAVAREQRARRDRSRGLASPAVSRSVRSVGVATVVPSSSPVSAVQRWAAFTAAGAAGVVLLPGGPDVVVTGVRWGWDNALGLVALLAAVVVALVVPKRVRSRKG